MTSRAAGDGLVAKSCPTLAAPWTVARQAPLSMGFSRKEYWTGLPFPSPGHLPNPWIKPGSPALQADSLPTELQGKPRAAGISVLYQSPKEKGRGQAKWVEKHKNLSKHLSHHTPSSPPKDFPLQLMGQELVSQLHTSLRKSGEMSF